MNSVDYSTMRASIADDVTSRTIQNEEAVVDLNSGTYFSLNETGSLIWRSLRDGRTFGEIVTRLVAEYDVTKETAEKEVSNLFDTLKENQLIRLG